MRPPSGPPPASSNNRQSNRFSQNPRMSRMSARMSTMRPQTMMRPPSQVVLPSAPVTLPPYQTMWRATLPAEPRQSSLWRETPASPSGDAQDGMPGPDGKIVTADGEEFKVATIPIKQFWFLTVGICLGLFLAMVDTSIVATSLYSIGADFGSGEAANWIALSYTLAYVGFAVIFARLSDIIGRRNAFLLAYVIFFAFSLGCGWCDDLMPMVMCRIFQGIGGAGLNTLALVMLPELAPPQLVQFIGAVVGLVIAFSGVLGPLLGGLLTRYASWRWVFWINGPIGGVSLAIFLWAWPKAEYLPSYEKRSWRSFDILGSLMTIASPTLLVFAMQHAGESYEGIWNEAEFLVPVCIAFLCLFVLIGWEMWLISRPRNQMALAFPVHLFKSRSYTAAAGTALLLGFPYILIIFSFPLRSQVVSDQDSLMSGVMLLPMLGATAVGTLGAGKLNAARNYLFETLLFGSVMMTLGCGLLSTVGGKGDDSKALGFLVFSGLGFGVTTAAASMIANIESPIRDYAPAQGIISQLRLLGGSLGISVSTVFLQTETKRYLHGILTEEQISRVMGTTAGLTEEQIDAVDKAYSEIFSGGMLVAAVVSAIAVLVSLLAFERNRMTFDEKRQERVAEETARRMKEKAELKELELQNPA